MGRIAADTSEQENYPFSARFRSLWSLEESNNLSNLSESAELFVVLLIIGHLREESTIAERFSMWLRWTKVGLTKRRFIREKITEREFEEFELNREGTSRGIKSRADSVFDNLRNESIAHGGKKKLKAINAYTERGINVCGSFISGKGRHARF